MQRYSKKRQAILECLQRTTAHPSAEWIYRELRAVHPDLSLATVYRNLNQLKEAGLIRSLGTVQGLERFDANVHPHPHAVCVHCGKILDMEDVPYSSEAAAWVEEKTGFRVEQMRLQFTGLCRECSEKEKEQ